MNVRAFAFAAIILTAACSPDAGVGPTGRNSNGGTTSIASDDKRAAGDSAGSSCSTAFTQGKGSCETSGWNGSTAKR